MKLKGFTLAELLTTLTIIGIIAALSIPATINNTKNRQEKLALQKAIKTLNEAVSLNVAKGKGDMYTYEDRRSARNIIEYLSLSIDTVGGVENADINRDDSDSFIETKDGIRFISPKLTGTDGSKNRCGTYGTTLGGSTAIRNTGPCVIVIDVDKSRTNATATSLTSLSSTQFKIWLTDKSVITSSKINKALGETDADASTDIPDSALSKKYQ